MDVQECCRFDNYLYSNKSPYKISKQAIEDKVCCECAWKIIELDLSLMLGCTNLSKDEKIKRMKCMMNLLKTELNENNRIVIDLDELINETEKGFGKIGKNFSYYDDINRIRFVFGFNNPMEDKNES